MLNKLNQEKLELALKLQAKELEPWASQYRSKELDKFGEAFSKAQAEFSPIKPNRENTFLKSRYADLEAILDSVKVALGKHSLSFIQQEEDHNGATTLTTTLLHASGQWVASRRRIVSKNEAQQQEFGKALSYERRYAAMCILGVATNQDKDDDDASDNTYQSVKRASTKLTVEPKFMGNETISTDQLEEIEMELDGFAEIGAKILDKFNIAELADIPKSQYSAIMKRTRELKQATLSAEGK